MCNTVKGLKGIRSVYVLCVFWFMIHKHCIIGYQFYKGAGHIALCRDTVCSSSKSPYQLPFLSFSFSSTSRSRKTPRHLPRQETSSRNLKPLRVVPLNFWTLTFPPSANSGWPLSRTRHVCFCQWSCRTNCLILGAAPSTAWMLWTM